MSKASTDVSYAIDNLEAAIRETNDLLAGISTALSQLVAVTAMVSSFSVEYVENDESEDDAKQESN